MFRCKDCGAEFEYPEQYRSADVIDVDYENENMCPMCDSFNIVKLRLCEFCNVEYTDESLCTDCQKIADDVANYAFSKYGMEADRFADLIYLRAYGV